MNWKMETIKIEGQLEIDTERGVIYFHSNETGWSKLRICGLPTPIPINDDLLDISWRAGIASWRGHED